MGGGREGEQSAEGGAAGPLERIWPLSYQKEEERMLVVQMLCDCVTLVLASISCL